MVNPLYEASDIPDSKKLSSRFTSDSESSDFTSKDLEINKPNYSSRSRRKCTCYCVIILIVGVTSIAALVMAILTAMNIVGLQGRYSNLAV